MTIELTKGYRDDLREELAEIAFPYGAEVTS
jgi:hypothetical protein